MIQLKGLDKAEVLVALYNASRPLGMGFLHYDPTPMTTEEAAELLKNITYFDYLKGRVMKIDLSGDELDPWGYDRDNGAGAAQRAIQAMGNARQLQEEHKAGVAQAAIEAKRLMGQNSEFKKDNSDGVTHINLGLSGVADVLGPAVTRALEE